MEAVFMDQEQWLLVHKYTAAKRGCMHVFEVKGDSLAMELFQDVPSFTR